MINHPNFRGADRNIFLKKDAKIRNGFSSVPLKNQINRNCSTDQDFQCKVPSHNADNTVLIQALIDSGQGPFAWMQKQEAQNESQVSGVARAAFLAVLLAMSANTLGGCAYTDCWRFSYFPLNDRIAVKNVIKQEGGWLGVACADEDIQCDAQFLLEAIKIDIDSLGYADGSVKKDKEFILRAIAIDYRALFYAHESLKRDKDFVLRALS